MTDRRTLLLGSAPLALFLAADPDAHARPEEQALLERVRALWLHHTQRADKLREGVLSTVGPSVDVAALDTIAEGLAWAGMAAACGWERPRDVVHPAFQAALREAATAIGDAVHVLSDTLARLDPAAIDPGSFLSAFNLLADSLDDPAEDSITRAQLGDARARMAEELRRDGLGRVLERKQRKLRQLADLGEGVASADSGLVESRDIALLAEVEVGAAAWGRGEVARDGLGAAAVVGIIALGLVIVGGFVVFGLGVSVSHCFCAGVPLMLLGLTIVVLGGMGIAGIVRRAGSVPVAQIFAAGWRPAASPERDGLGGTVWATGLLKDRGSGWSFGPRGRALATAPAGAPMPGGKLGALVARTARRPDSPFYAMGAHLSAAEAEGLEVACNVGPAPTVYGRGFRVFWRPERR